MRSALSSLVILLSCGVPPAPEVETPAAATAAPAPASLAPETMQLAPSVIPTMKAWPGGLAVADASGQLTRYRNVAGKLELAQTGPVIERLLDADNHGNLYIFTKEKGESAVIQLAPDGRETVVMQNRGVWTFAISPEGHTFRSSSCGPTGIFEYPSSPLKTALETPATDWETGVLTGDRTLWSLSGGLLVRTTPEGSVELGRPSGALARCGAHICGVRSGQVTVLDDNGAVLRTVLAPESTTVVDVTGSSDGLYLLLEGPAGREVKLVR